MPPRFYNAALTFFALIAFHCMATGTAIAADPAQGEPSAEQQKIDADKEAIRESANPYLAKYTKRTHELGQEFDSKALDHLFHIREGFGTIEAIVIVKRDIAAAIKACDKANPDMAHDLDGHFGAWSQKVDPLVKAKQDEIDTAIDSQTYTKPKEIKDYLKLEQQTAEYANRNLDKRIVDTPEACGKLRDSLDKTGDTVVKSLNEITMLPWPPPASDNSAPMSLPPGR